MVCAPARVYGNSDLSSNSLTGVLPSFFDSSAYWIANNVNVLNFAYNKLTGMIPSYVLQFPAVLKLSNNQFTNLAPSLEYVVDVGFAFYIDVSSNQLSGTIPEYLGSISPALSYLDVTNNPLLQTACSTPHFQSAVNCLPSASFLTINPNETVLVGSNSVCQSISATRAGLTIRADPSYLQYQQCYCSPNYFRQLNGSELGEPFRNSTAPTAPSCLSCAAADATLVAPCSCQNGIVRGCYPVPFDSVWQAVVACPTIGVGYTSCNPLADPSNPNAPQPSPAAQNVSFACAVGYEGRLCSQCLPGYLLSSRSCTRCPEPNFVRPLIPIAFVVFLGIAIIFLLNVRAARFRGVELAGSVSSARVFSATLTGAGDMVRVVVCGCGCGCV